MRNLQWNQAILKCLVTELYSSLLCSLNQLQIWPFFSEQTDIFFVKRIASEPLESRNTQGKLDQCLLRQRLNRLCLQVVIHRPSQAHSLEIRAAFKEQVSLRSQFVAGAFHQEAVGNRIETAVVPTVRDEVVKVHLPQIPQRLEFVAASEEVTSAHAIVPTDDLQVGRRFVPEARQLRDGALVRDGAAVQVRQIDLPQRRHHGRESPEHCAGNCPLIQRQFRRKGRVEGRHFGEDGGRGQIVQFLVRCVGTAQVPVSK
mmetsp:Transcript_20/g.31  ORF Transcript_20/g.31 Transcript_20/m.31 type:complete len:258 (-) Transcript_20:115-888(-)